MALAELNFMSGGGSGGMPIGGLTNNFTFNTNDILTDDNFVFDTGQTNAETKCSAEYTCKYDGIYIVSFDSVTSGYNNMIWGPSTALCINDEEYYLGLTGNITEIPKLYFKANKNDIIRFKGAGSNSRWWRFVTEIFFIYGSI